MRCKLTVSIDESVVEELENTRTTKTEHPRVVDDKSHFIEKILVIGLSAYKQKQKFFDTVNLNNIDLSKINF
jgi:hypothetical protein